MNDEEVIENLEMLQDLDLFEEEDSEVILELQNFPETAEGKGDQK